VGDPEITTQVREMQEAKAKRSIKVTDDGIETKVREEQD